MWQSNYIGEESINQRISSLLYKYGLSTDTLRGLSELDYMTERIDMIMAWCVDPSCNDLSETETNIDSDVDVLEAYHSSGSFETLFSEFESQCNRYQGLYSFFFDYGFESFSVRGVYITTRNYYLPLGGIRSLLDDSEYLCSAIADESDQFGLSGDKTKNEVMAAAICKRFFEDYDNYFSVGRDVYDARRQLVWDVALAAATIRNYYADHYVSYSTEAETASQIVAFAKYMSDVIHAIARYNKRVR